MTRNPIPKVLSIFFRHRVKALLIGGQACILYGAAEFSRDIDLSVLISTENLEALRKVLRELEAEPVFYPDLSVEALLNRMIEYVFGLLNAGRRNCLSC